MGTALLTGLGRINFGLEQAVFSSRYMTITLTFWSVLFIYWLVVLPRLIQEVSSTVQTVVVALSGLIVGIAVLTQEQHATALSMRKPEFNTAGIAIMLGVSDRELLKTLYPFPEDVMNLVAILRAYKVSLFADQSFNIVGQTLQGKFAKRDTNTCVGYFDSVQALQQASGFAKVNGWGWDLRKAAVSIW